MCLHDQNSIVNSTRRIICLKILPSFLSFFLITISFQCKCVFVLYLLRIYLHARRGQQNLGETTMQLLRINEKTTKKEILIT